MDSTERQFEGMTPEEIKSLLNARIRQVQDLLETTRMQRRRRSKLLNLLLDCLKLIAFSFERKESIGMTPEVYALHISSLYQDDVSFRADHEKIVVAFVVGGTKALNAMTLKGREIISLLFRGSCAVVLLWGRLQWSLDELSAHGNIIIAENALNKLSEDFSAPLFAEFDESSLDGDTETALRALLIDAWNKYDEKYFAKLSTEGFENIVRVFGFRECRPQFGQDDRQ